MTRLAVRYAMVALLFFGSATLLFSCDDSSSAASLSEEGLMTDFSEHLSVVQSRNGRRSYVFTSPLVEGYGLAREPYREFRKGVEITTFLDDSLQSVDTRLTANYAIYYEKRELWEAKGDVVVEKSDGKTLYTQQLFWNARTKKIYSNVDSKIIQSGGRDVFVGEGFESDEEFKDWRFRRMKGRMEVDVAPKEQPDSLTTNPAKSEVMSNLPTSSALVGNKNSSDPTARKATRAATKAVTDPTIPRPLTRADHRIDTKPLQKVAAESGSGKDIKQTRIIKADADTPADGVRLSPDLIEKPKDIE